MLDDKTQAILKQLKGLHLPEAIGFWPLAPGWYLILGFLLLFLCGLTYFLIQRQRHRRALKHALLELEHFSREFQLRGDVQRTVSNISGLLKRVAIAYFSRSDVASLHGQAWLLFLDTTSGSNLNFATKGQLLITAPFDNKASGDVRPLFEMAARWIKER